MYEIDNVLCQALIFIWKMIIVNFFERKSGLKNGWKFVNQPKMGIVREEYTSIYKFWVEMGYFDLLKFG